MSFGHNHDESEPLFAAITPQQLLNDHEHVDANRMVKLKINYHGVEVTASGTYAELQRYFKKGEGQAFIKPKTHKPYVQYDTFIHNDDAFWYRFGLLFTYGAGFISTGISIGLVYLTANYLTDIELGRQSKSYFAPISVMLTTVASTLLFGGVKTIYKKYEEAAKRVEKVPNYQYHLSKY